MTMSRYINALLVFLMVLLAAAVYDMKYEAELASEAIVRQENEVAQTREDISLLKAEWALLTRPGRMQDLVNRHAAILDLVPMSVDHIGTVAEIPDKPADPAPPSAGADRPTRSADGRDAAEPARTAIR